MKSINTSFIGLLALVLFSCGNTVPKQEIEILFTQVMEGHDEIMPKMGELIMLKKKLSKQLDSGAENKKEIENELFPALDIDHSLPISPTCSFRKYAVVASSRSN